MTTEPTVEPVATQPRAFPCVGCAHCGCDPEDWDDACYVCADCDDFADGNPE